MPHARGLRLTLVTAYAIIDDIDGSFPLRSTLEGLPPGRLHQRSAAMSQRPHGGRRFGHLAVGGGRHWAQMALLCPLQNEAGGCVDAMAAIPLRWVWMRVREAPGRVVVGLRSFPQRAIARAGA